MLLYVAYLLVFTTVATKRAQDDLLATWHAQVGTLPVGDPAIAGVTPVPAAPPLQPPGGIAIGDAYAAIWFERAGSRTAVHGVPYSSWKASNPSN